MDFPAYEQSFVSAKGYRLGNLRFQGQTISPAHQNFASDFGIKSAFIPVEFQLNLAFSKAYFIEQLGSGIGLEKNSAFYVENGAINVMAEFLHNRCFHEWVGKNVRADGIPSQIVPAHSQYMVTTVDSGEEFEIRVMRDAGQGSPLYYAFRYTKSSIQVDNNGLKTCVHKLVGGEIPQEFVDPWANVKLDHEARVEMIKSLPPK
jgi:hypothetical protein